MRTRQAFITLSIVAAFLLSGCASRQLQFHVNVDSISSEVATLKKSYVLLPGNKDTTVEDLQFKEFMTYVHRALTANGFVQANNLEKADIVIFLVYGIGNPQEHLYSYSLPAWGQTGVSSSTTSGTINMYGNFGTYSGTTTYAPKYGITGYTSHVASYTTYFRYMLLDAYDLDIYRRKKKLSQIWRTTVTSTGSSDDLRRVFPVLVAGSAEFLGANTGQNVRVILREEDPEVLEIKGVPPEQPKSTDE
jgi:outer membrane murein-binding lipoprotein Lpp